MNTKIYANRFQLFEVANSGNRYLIATYPENRLQDLEELRRSFEQAQGNWGYSIYKYVIIAHPDNL